MPPPRVDFLIAGVQKGGTTALFDHLREHPGLQLPSLKEARFFDNDNLDWDRPDYDRYHRLFDFGAPAVRGEATPIYVYWPNSLERIAAYNPALRLILLFRDPRTRAWSQWRMEHARGFETEPFSWCIREGRARLANDPETPGFHRVFSYVERGFYGRQLQRVRALFPPEQVLLLRSEDLQRAPDETLAHVCRFLGLEPFTEPVRPRAVNISPYGNRAPTPAPADMELMTSLFADELELFASLSGLPVDSWRM